MIGKTKICCACKIEKSIDEFYKDRSNKDGLLHRCIGCLKKQRAERHDKIKQQNNISYYKHREERKKQMNHNYQKNRELLKKQAQEYRDKNREYYRNYFKEYSLTEKRRKYNNNWRRKEYHNNPAFKLNDKMAGMINQTLKGNKNGRSWGKLVGYTCEDLKKHLESLFTERMTWEKYLNGEIHIDHIIPKSLFNITGPKSIGFKKCWALENLRPMWAKDNLRKYNKLFAA